MKQGNDDDIDESLYSRQLYVMGHEAQRKMAASSVLIMGLDGLGVEVAKNVILAGVKSVALYDTKTVSHADLASQFYLSEDTIGANRAVVSYPKLAELNPHVSVSILNDFNMNTLQDNYKVVVLVDVPVEQRTKIADYCHAKGVYVLAGDTRGVFGRIFCDFGPNFVVTDSDGESAFSSMVASITCEKRALVTVLEETRHNLNTGDVMVLSELPDDLGQLLNGKEFTVEVKDPFSFYIEADTSSCAPYTRSGYVNQVKQPTTISFRSYSETVASPGEFVCDFSKIHRAGQLHLAYQCLDDYQQQHGGMLPEPGNIAQAEELFQQTCAMNEAIVDDGKVFKVSTKELQDEEKLIQRLALCSRGQIAPITGLLGGILGQEVLKACSGKFMPIRQWFYYDAIECLPDEPLPAEEVAPQGCRYDGQIMVFGKTMQQKIGQLNMFLVGAGAIGCEMIKNWAMMGVACKDAATVVGQDATSKAGTVYVTDMDQIEKSNLSRQFLFRNSDINCPKSTTAVRAVTVMNPALQSVAYESKVAADTEDLFNDDFFESLDMVCTALDNVEARLYIDQKCVFYQKPMLESGTLGAKGHTQIVVPFTTENYGATRDPPEKSIPVCTLKHFPNQIDHTLQWARDWFEEVYSIAAQETVQYLTDPDFANPQGGGLAAQQNMRLDTLNRIEQMLKSARPLSMNDCIIWARVCFEELFANNVKQLLHNFPLDRLTAAGTPFWSGAKKPPTPIAFDPSDPLHMEFILAVANLRADMFGLLTGTGSGTGSTTMDPSLVTEIVHRTPVPQFQPRDGVKIAATEDEAKAEAAAPATAAAPSTDIDVQCAEILSSLPNPAELTAGGFQVQPIVFDKDVDAHMRVVAAVSNLRARNYAIPEADLHTSRGIAGRITPAIATTTAMVTAAICVELYKVVLNKPIEQLKNTFSNLALPLFTSAEPDPPKSTTAVVKGKDWKWNQVL